MAAASPGVGRSGDVRSEAAVDVTGRFLDANRSNWDERVAIHTGSEFYDVAAWLQHRPGPRERERQALGPVEALELVHLQCHFGMDTLAWADAGAAVTGVDFSPAAIAAAEDLARQAGLAQQARFVCADVYAAAETLAPQTFDIVYVSLGALCWLPSVERWADQVARLLRPNGRLYLHDGHPLAWSLDDHSPTIAYTYFEERDPFVGDSVTTYTDGERLTTNTRTYEWNHGLGEIATALLARGLRIDQLTEHDWTVHQRFPWLLEVRPGEWSTPPDMPRTPLSFTLVATNVG